MTQIGMAKNSNIASGLIKKMLLGVNSDVVRMIMVAMMDAISLAMISFVIIGKPLEFIPFGKEESPTFQTINAKTPP